MVPSKEEISILILVPRIQYITLEIVVHVNKIIPCFYNNFHVKKRLIYIFMSNIDEGFFAINLPGMQKETT